MLLGFNRPAVSEERLFENVDDVVGVGVAVVNIFKQPLHCLSYKLPEAFGSGELNCVCPKLFRLHEHLPFQHLK